MTERAKEFLETQSNRHRLFVDNSPPRMHDDTDQDLITAYLAGSGNALAILVDRHMAPVSAFCFQLELNRSLAEDLTQETFLRAIRGLKSFRGGSRFQTWLFAIASNLAKSRATRGLRETTGIDEVEPPKANVQDAPDHSTLQMELEREVESAMQDLPLPLRSSLVQSIVHGLTPQQIAAAEGCPVNTVYWRIHEARKFLKGRLRLWTS